MRNRSFGEFVDKKKRDSIKELNMVHRVLESQGMKSENFTREGEDPYIFCHNPSKTTSFDGVRIYKIGNQIAFRVQKEHKTHPYGEAYPLNIEEMFHDFLTDKGADKQRAGERVIKSVVAEIKKFFEQSSKAEKAVRNDTKGQIMVSNMPTDYGLTIK